MLEKSEKAEPTRRCQVCGKKSVYVFESRTVQPGICNESHRRRRLVCKSCGARFTSREISDELFQMLMKHSELLRKASFEFKQTFWKTRTPAETVSTWSRPTSGNDAGWISRVHDSRRPGLQQLPKNPFSMISRSHPKPQSKTSLNLFKPTKTSATPVPPSGSTRRYTRSLLEIKRATSCGAV